MHGTVKWFDPKKGYGFILGDDKKEYFVHFSAILTNGFKTLHEGDEVRFSTDVDKKGVKAINVEVL